MILHSNIWLALSTRVGKEYGTWAFWVVWAFWVGLTPTTTQFSREEFKK